MIRRMRLIWKVVRFAFPRAVKLVRLRAQARVYAAAGSRGVRPDACGAYRYGGTTELRQAVCGNCGRLAAEHARPDTPIPACKRCGCLLTSHALPGEPHERGAGACFLCDCPGFE